MSASLSTGAQPTPTGVLVLGMHRSGTSALTGLLRLMGCYVGRDDVLMPVKEDNPKGYWERMDVYRLNDELLAALGEEWHTAAAVDPGELDGTAAPAFGERMDGVVQDLEAHRPWALKDPRLCLLLPLWRPRLPAVAAILIHRPPLEVARSLELRHGLPTPVGMALWEAHALAALAASRDLPRWLVTYGELLERPTATCRRLHGELEGLGLAGLRPPAPEAVRELIDPSLFRARGDAGEQEAYLNPARRRLLDSLADGSALTAPPPALSADSRAILAAHRAAWRTRSRATTLEAESVRLRGERDGLLRERDELSRTLRELVAERDALAARVSGEQRERERLAAEGAELERARSALAEERDRLLVELHAQRAEAGNALEKVSELAAAIANLEERLREREAALRRSAEELAESRARLEATVSTLRALEASRSYRLGRALTRPAAALRRLGRGGGETG